MMTVSPVAAFGGGACRPLRLWALCHGIAAEAVAHSSIIAPRVGAATFRTNDDDGVRVAADRSHCSHYRRRAKPRHFGRKAMATDSGSATTLSLASTAP